MQVGLHVAKVWGVHVLVVMATVGALGLLFALVDDDWRDRLTDRNEPVTVTITGQHRNDFGCGTKYRRPGWDWEATWTQDGRIRVGSLETCAEAPAAGTKVDTYVSPSGRLGGTSQDGYVLWWVVVSLGLGTLLTPLWLQARGKEAFDAVKAEG